MKLKFKEISGYKIFYRNEEEFKIIYKQIFADEDYKLSSRTEASFIIDCGSHIGLSILYFKSKYPNADILGFEPNPENFQILQKNIQVNNSTNIKVINAALSNKAEKTILHTSLEKDNPWTWGDTLVSDMWEEKITERKIPIRTVKLSDYINKNVDFMKMDIEGAEKIVLQEISNKLHYINEVVLEYHTPRAVRGLNEYRDIKSLLEKNGFNVHLDGWIPKITISKSFWKPLSFGWLALIRATKLVKTSR
ncbi:MAG: FkbM family methyltransferase [Patescibacteria group bacterium]